MTRLQRSPSLRRAAAMSSAAVLLAHLSVSVATAQETPPEPAPERPHAREALIENALNRHGGGVMINQEAGDGVSQANVLALAAAGDAAVAETIATSLGAAPQRDAPATARLARFADAVLDASGLVMVNQSAGVGARQVNAAAFALSGDGPAIASATARLSAGTDQILIGEARGEIVGVGTGATGLIAVNQDVGAGNAQANVQAVAVSRDGPAQALALADMRRETPPAPVVETPIVEPGLDPAVAPTGEPAPSDTSSEAVSEAAGAGPAVLVLADSFNGAVGVVQVSQAAGRNNAQANLFAAAVGRGLAHAGALADTDLAAVAPPETTGEGEDEASQGALLASNNFQDFTGVAQVSRVIGSNNQVTNAFAVSLTRVEGTP